MLKFFWISCAIFQKLAVRGWKDALFSISLQFSSYACSTEHGEQKYDHLFI